MTTAIIITLCVLLLIAYLFDVSAGRTRIPAVILLLLLGWLLRQCAIWLNISLPNFNILLPIFGTIGLIMIVLEGALELELNRGKLSLLLKTLSMAVFPMLALAFLIAAVTWNAGLASFKTCLASAIPISVISSSVAIPSVKNFDQYNKEFVIYESSISDIVGVLFFNFVALNENIGLASVGYFSLELIIMTLISFAATIGLAFLLRRIDHQIKFAPIIILVVLIYSISKIYHLPALIFIMLFGVFLGNLNNLKHFRLIQHLHPRHLSREVRKLHHLLVEGTFIIRSLFFILFGYLLKTEELLDAASIPVAAAITVAIFALRGIMLRIFRLPLFPLLFIAPRGLITILLFLSLKPEHMIPQLGKPVIVQVIILSALVMMSGMLLHKNKPQQEPLETEMKS